MRLVAGSPPASSLDALAKSPGRIARAAIDARLLPLRRLPILDIGPKLWGLNSGEQSIHIILRMKMRMHQDVVHLSLSHLKGREVSTGRRAALATSGIVWAE